LWGAVVGRPSTKKSPALQTAIRQIRRLEAESVKAFESECDEYEIRKQAAEIAESSAKTEARKAIRKGDQDEAEGIISEARGKRPDPPVLRRYTTSDVTAEKLGEILSENPRGVLVFRDELAGWLASLDKDGR